MIQTLSKNTKELLNNISKNILLQIQEYVPFNKILNIFRCSKKYQKYLNINLSTYQKCFIKKKIKFDISLINNDILLSYFQKEFHNFTT